MKNKILLILVCSILLFIIGFFTFKKFCQSNPECSCKFANPGDITCTSIEDLTFWCKKQQSQTSLPQCMGLEGIYPVEKIVQGIIDSNELQPYFHPEIEGRVPLVINDHLLNLNLNLQKFDLRVNIVPDQDVTGAYLRFTTFDCKLENYCNVSFEYKVEGIIGHTGVWIGNDGAIKLEKTSVYEE